MRRTSASAPAPRSSSQNSAVRRSCQTMAGATGTDVARSHTIVVSRWLAMPMPAMSAADTPALSRAPRAVASCACQSCSASCSTQPGCGVLRPASCWALARTTPAASITSARPLVVPVSSASTSLPVVSPMPPSVGRRPPGPAAAGALLLARMIPGAAAARRPAAASRRARQIKQPASSLGRRPRVHQVNTLFWSVTTNFIPDPGGTVLVKGVACECDPQSSWKEEPWAGGRSWRPSTAWCWRWPTPPTPNASISRPPARSEPTLSAT